VGDLIPGRTVVPHPLDHLAAAVVGRHRLQQRRLGDQRPASHGTEHFVAGEGVEVAVDRLHVHAEVRAGLRAVHHRHRARRVRQFAELRGGIHGPSEFETYGKATILGLRVEGAPEVGQVDPSVLGDLDHPQRSALLLTQYLPWHDVRVMVHRRHDDGVTAPNVGPAP